MTSSLQTTKSAGFWTPPSALVNHKGDALDARMVFFAPPPPEIGQVLSAHSEMTGGRTSTKAKGMALLYQWYLPVFGLIFGFFFIVLNMTDSVWIRGLVAFAVFCGICWISDRAKGRPIFCTYVGTDGVALCVWNKDKTKCQIPTTLRFEDIRCINGAYYHTTTTPGPLWTEESPPDGDGIVGLYRHPQGTPPARDPNYFGFATENAWIVYKLECALQNLAQGNSVTFEIKNGDTLTLSRDAFELRRKGETIHLGCDDEPKLQVQNGVLKLSSKDTTRSFFGSKGAYQFKYHDVSGAKLLLVLFDTLMKR